MSITLIIVILTALLSIRAFNDQGLFSKLQHRPYLEVQEKQYYRLISSGFIHANWLHLLINMFVLYEFGRIVEAHYLDMFGELMGRISFVLLYIFTIIAGDIPTLLKHRQNPNYASIGASGAVSGIVFVYILFYPWAKIYLYAVIPIYGIVAGVLYLVYSSWAGKNSRDIIDHEAHFYGALFGMLFTIILYPPLFPDFINRLVEQFPF